jgi:hypothetical protein
LNEQTWTTSDGRQFQISELTEGHLANLLPFIRRKARVRAYTWAQRCDAYAADAPDGAADAASREAAQWMSLALGEVVDDAQLCEAFDEPMRSKALAIFAEAKRRGVIA